MFFFFKKAVLLETCWSLAASELSAAVLPPCLLGACVREDLGAETSVVAERQRRATQHLLPAAKDDRGAWLGRAAGGPPTAGFVGRALCHPHAGPVWSPLPRKGNGIQQLAQGRSLGATEMGLHPHPLAPGCVTGLSVRVRVRYGSA